jgi:hypothetical protein
MLAPLLLLALLLTSLLSPLCSVFLSVPALADALEAAGVTSVAACSDML